jgi:hypothetical protein
MDVVGRTDVVVLADVSICADSAEHNAIPPIKPEVSARDPDRPRMV